MKKLLFILSLVILPAVASAQNADIDPLGQTSGSECVKISYDLRLTSRDTLTGGQVSSLQFFLQSQGLLNSEPTGYFGLLTQAAVMKFQAQNGIVPVSGFVGPITRAAINKSSCGSVSTSVPAQDPVYVAPDYNQVPTERLSVKSMEIIGEKNTYEPGQIIKYSVKGKASDGKVANPYSGLHVQARMKNSSNKFNDETVSVNGVYQSVNATYNYNSNMWEVVMTAPYDGSHEYTIDSIFYCSQPSICDDGQINKNFDFRLKSYDEDEYEYEDGNEDFGKHDVDVSLEQELRGPATYSVAERDCRSDGMRLPTWEELTSDDLNPGDFLTNAGYSQEGRLWTQTACFNGFATVWDGLPSVVRNGKDINAQYPYNNCTETFTRIHYQCVANEHATNSPKLDSVSWQERGDVPYEGNSIYNRNSDIYYNPRIVLDSVERVPYHNSETATEWCENVPGKDYNKGRSVVQGDNPTNDLRFNYDDGEWNENRTGDYPRKYICE